MVGFACALNLRTHALGRWVGHSIEQGLMLGFGEFVVVEERRLKEIDIWGEFVEGRRSGILVYGIILYEIHAQACLERYLTALFPPTELPPSLPIYCRASAANWRSFLLSRLCLKTKNHDISKNLSNRRGVFVCNVTYRSVRTP